MTNRKGKPKKQEISLMTILAYEATSGSRKLLKQYGREDAKNYVDLENKLTDLYYATEDKPKLERELAEIHPHKNWILKTLAPAPVVEEKKEIVVEAAPAEQKQQGCGCGGNCPCKQSSFDGTGSNQTQTKPADSMKFENYFGMIALVGVVGIAFYALTKSK
jgi:hypothetical protein